MVIKGVLWLYIDVPKNSLLFQSIHLLWEVYVTLTLASNIRGDSSRMWALTLTVQYYTDNTVGVSSQADNLPFLEQ